MGLVKRALLSGGIVSILASGCSSDREKLAEIVEKKSQTEDLPYTLEICNVDGKRRLWKEVRCFDAEFRLYSTPKGYPNAKLVIYHEGSDDPESQYHDYGIDGLKGKDWIVQRIQLRGEDIAREFVVGDDVRASVFETLPETDQKAVKARYDSLVESLLKIVGD
ncbi:MAG: hypothetical protein WC595_01675 [Candidatus Nanoarchaeia archaeon]